MNEQTQPTDAEIEAAWTDATGSSILPYPDDMLAFARAVLAKWGTPAPVGAEPVALLVRKNSWRDGQWEAAPPNSPSYGLAWANQRVYVYTTPQPTQTQPVEREPLTDEWIRSRCKESWIFDAAKQWVRMTEAEHGIKGDQHGAYT